MTKRKYFLFFILLLLLDQVIKYFFNKYYPNIISLNTGIIFGFINQIYGVYLIIIVGFGLLIYLLFFDKKYFNFGLVLILAGAISNILDRLFYGGVVDYISLGNLTNFNFSDLMIIIGVIIYFLKLKKPYKL